MGRTPCCSKVGLHKGQWSSKEDKLLSDYIQIHGEGHWRSLPKNAGLLRCGKSCRLRWLNYLRPDIKRGNITPAEDDIILRLHRLLGNRWSLIAGRLPGRTDNEIKNYWNTHLSKRFQNHGTGSVKKTAKNETIICVPRPRRVSNQKERMEDVSPLPSPSPSPTSKTASLTLDRIAEAVAFLENTCDNDYVFDSSLQKLYEEYMQLLKPSN